MKGGGVCSPSDENACTSCNTYLIGTAVCCFILGTFFGENLKSVTWSEYIDIPISLFLTCCAQLASRIRLFATTRWHIGSHLLSWLRQKRTDLSEEDEYDEDTAGELVTSTEDPCDAKRKNWKARQRSTNFAKSIRKFSLLHDNRVSHGLIEAMGEGLEIVSIDPTMRRLLGWPTESKDQAEGGPSLPTSVHDLLPEAFRSIHRQFLAKAIADGALPSSLMHPLRNVQMLRLDDSVVRVNVCIGLITKDIPISSKECMFYALVSEREDAPPAMEKTAAQVESAGQDREDSIASITEARTCPNPPAPLRHFPHVLPVADLAESWRVAHGDLARPSTASTSAAPSLEGTCPLRRSMTRSSPLLHPRSASSK
jgi:hypothetical protein